MFIFFRSLLLLCYRIDLVLFMHTLFSLLCVILDLFDIFVYLLDVDNIEVSIFILFHLLIILLLCSKHQILAQVDLLVLLLGHSEIHGLLQAFIIL